MDSTKDYYSVLGVLPGAEDIVIRAAYKALAQRYHPDRYSESKDEANRIMASINEAYSVLSDPFRRREYDQASGVDKKARGFHSNEGSNDVSSRYDPPKKPGSDLTEPKGTPPTSTSSAKSKFDFLSVESAAIFSVAFLVMVVSGLWFMFSGEPGATKEVALHESKETDVAMGPGRIFKDCMDCPDMVEIPTGVFEMGSNDPDVSFTGPMHRVVISRSFALARTEVTQGQWRFVMGNSQSHFSSCGDDCPAENVSWVDAKIFVQKLSQITGKTYRLPSEAEWEFACRAGKTHAYCGSDEINSVSWYAGNSDGRTQPVARKQNNYLGLYDMTGNVTEWTEDCDGIHGYKGAPTDGSAWISGDCNLRKRRGGSFGSSPEYMTRTYRERYSTATRHMTFGLRPVRVLP